MIYLASPYSHPDSALREQRFRAACRATAALLRAGRVAFSPIVHSHPLVAHGLPTDWDFWQRCDREHLRHCDDVLVLMLDGWRESAGVLAEVQLAEELRKPVRYADPDDLIGSHLTRQQSCHRETERAKYASEVLPAPRKEIRR